jgi:NADH-quinone oxidoreductase subunit H
VLWFLAKLVMFVFLFIWLRGSLPRIRYDQLMALGWKVLIPASLAWALLIATVRLYRQHGGSTPVYLVAGGILVTIIAVFAGLDSAAARRQETRASDDEAAGLAESPFPVPPLDLPHYHGEQPAAVGQRPAGVAGPAAGELGPGSGQEVGADA